MHNEFDMNLPFKPLRVSIAMCPSSFANLKPVLLKEMCVRSRLIPQWWCRCIQSPSIADTFSYTYFLNQKICSRVVLHSLRSLTTGSPTPHQYWRSPKEGHPGCKPPTSSQAVEGIRRTTKFYMVLTLTVPVFLLNRKIQNRNPSATREIHVFPLLLTLLLPIPGFVAGLATSTKLSFWNVQDISVPKMRSQSKTSKPNENAKQHNQRISSYYHII